MMTLTNWLLALMGAALTAVSVLGLILNYRMQIRWMRIFSESQGIPAITMEPKPSAHNDVVKLGDVKKKVAFSIPVPGAQMFKSK